MDGRAVLFAGCFTRSPDKNRESALDRGVGDLSRVYATYQEMAACPGPRRYPTIEDGIDGLRFVDACVKRNAQGIVWVSV